MDDLKDIQIDIFLDNEQKKDEELKEDIKSVKQPRSRGHAKRTVKGIYRRAFSETQLLDIMPEIEKNTVYNFITGGDIDALSYLKIILRQKKTLDYCMFSTWCMALEDVSQFSDWIDQGKIKKLDAYVGEIFKGTYLREYIELEKVVKKCGGKIVVFRNHSKIFAGYSKDFYFGIQTSANINTNPRTENGCIQTGKDIFDFYNDYFSEIVGFNK